MVLEKYSRPRIHFPRPFTVIANSLSSYCERRRTTLARTTGRRIGAQDIPGAQQAWFAARRGWESAEVITDEAFPDLDSAIAAWPDAQAGFHAIEVRLFLAQNRWTRSARIGRCRGRNLLAYRATRLPRCEARPFSFRQYLDLCATRITRQHRPKRNSWPPCRLPYPRGGSCVPRFSRGRRG